MTTKHRKSQPKLRRRKLQIIAEMVRLSSFKGYICRRDDWQSLEDELNAINMRGA